MPFGSFDAEKVAKAAEEFSQQMGEIYKHECYGQRKRECKLNMKLMSADPQVVWRWMHALTLFVYSRKILPSIPRTKHFH